MNELELLEKFAEIATNYLIDFGPCKNAINSTAYCANSDCYYCALDKIQHEYVKFKYPNGISF